jgi:hypothetical protein
VFVNDFRPLIVLLFSFIAVLYCTYRSIQFKIASTGIAYPSNSTEQSPSEPNCRLATEKIPRNLWDPRIHYSAHKSPPLVTVLSQLNPVLISHFFKIQFNTFPTPKPSSSMWSVPFRFSDQNLCAFIISPMRTTYPAHLLLLDPIVLILFCDMHTIELLFFLNIFRYVRSCTFLALSRDRISPFLDYITSMPTLSLSL